MENYEKAEREMREYMANQRFNFSKMTSAERLHTMVSTLILGGARPDVRSLHNNSLAFFLKKEGISQYFSVEKLIIDNPEAFFEVMDGIDNALQLPTEARMSLNGRKEFFAKMLYDRFATFDLSDSKLPEKIPNRPISADWNEWMQGKYAVVNDKARENPDRFGDIVEGLCQDYEFDGKKNALYKVTSMRQVVACSTISTFKSKEAFREDVEALENNFGANKIVEDANDVVDKVNELISMNAHQFKRVDLYDSDSEGAKE
ncbi:MAG: hypothetical protein K6F08_00080 [bacterium]|nr:hypothetical protein [bacterium]